MDVNQVDVYFSFIYFVIVVCFVLPPKEFAAAGLTIQNIFASYLGSEHVDFIGYHLKRTSVTVLVHCLLPLVYYVGLGFVTQNWKMLTLHKLSPSGSLFALICISTALSGVLIFCVWSYQNWMFHPLARDLCKYGAPWRAVAAQINLEFRRVEKFSSVTGGTAVYVTDSWIIKSTAYKVHIAQQTDAHLAVLKSEEFDFSHENNQGTQYLQIKVATIPPHETSFNLNLHSFEYNDLKDRLSSPIRNARDIVIHQSISDRFIKEFKAQVSLNGAVEVPSLMNQDEEKCIGCMEKNANVKLLKRCANLSDGECKQCYCRPMWCLDCMGRWFASRQNQNEPETWMSSLSPCPTCRSKFCMLDVFAIIT